MRRHAMWCAALTLGIMGCDVGGSFDSIDEDPICAPGSALKLDNSGYGRGFTMEIPHPGNLPCQIDLGTSIEIVKETGAVFVQGDVYKFAGRADDLRVNNPAPISCTVSQTAQDEQDATVKLTSTIVNGVEQLALECADNWE